MNDRSKNDTDATVQLPRIPVEVEEFDPDKTVVVEDWSQIAMPSVPTGNTKR